MDRHDCRARSTDPTVTIRVAGKLYQGHLSYLDQLVYSAGECRLWPVLNLSHLEQLDREALLYLMRGEQQSFGIVSCPSFIRQWIEHERGLAAA